MQLRHYRDVLAAKPCASDYSLNDKNLNGGKCHYWFCLAISAGVALDCEHGLIGSVAKTFDE